MKRTIALLLFLSLFLLACKPSVAGGERPTDTEAALAAVRIGTQGIDINFVPNYPPAVVYDQNELTALVEVHNRGNHPLEATDCFVQITGFDPNIIQGGFNVPRSCTENIGTLEGKTVYNIQGSQNQMEFRSTSITLPPNVFDYNPMLNVKACYTYHTKASPQVCLDPLVYQITSEQKACDYRTPISAGGGQGAPVGIGYVQSEMVNGRAIFDINVVNYGTGRIISPDADIRGCDTGLAYTDLDKLRYSVKLSAGTSIDCKPRDGTVRLFNNQGKIVCTFDIPGSASYQTPLQIDLDYGYIQSFQRQVRIIQTPQ